MGENTIFPGSSWESPRHRRPVGNARIPSSPLTPCTPIRPQWEMRCEEAASRSPWPTQFGLKQSSKGEDRLTVDVRLGSEDTVWAIFDGHRAHEISAYAARVLPGLVWASPFWPSQPEHALASALRECHEDARREDLRGGSTAVVVACTGDQLWCASAGDSRAIVGLVGGGVKRVSVDHTARSPEELRRIQESGGSVEWGHLGGTLPMSRGIGNFDLEAAGFLCSPDVRSMPTSEVDFLVVASDGLWDVMSDEACADEVRSMRSTHSVGIADSLIQRAERLGSHDDISVIVVFFQRKTQARDVSFSPPVPRPHLGSLTTIPSNSSFEAFLGEGFGAFPHFTMQAPNQWRPPPPVRSLPFSTLGPHPHPPFDLIAP